MKKIILFVIISLILLGCKTQSPTITPRYTDYKTGIRGLDINFIKSQPPDEIWEESDILIGLELQNKGAYIIEQGKLKLTYDKNYFDMYDFPDEIEALEGKGQFYPEGEKYIGNYDGKNIKKIPFGKDAYSAIFNIRACYPYKTEASADICLNPSDYDYLKIEQEACKPNKVFSLKGQGSPLAITQIEEIILPIDEIDYKVQFIINIENKGSGKVRDINAYHKECEKGEGLEPEEVDVFEIQEISFSDFSTSASGKQYIDCNPKPNVELKNNKAQIICSAVIKKSRGIFQTPLKISLNYGYVIEKEKITKIRKIKTN